MIISFILVVILIWAFKFDLSSSQRCFTLTGTMYKFTFRRMETHSPSDFEMPMPTLPPDVVVCDGIPRGSWNTK